MSKTKVRGSPSLSIGDVSKADAWRVLNHFRRQFRASVGRAYRPDRSDAREVRLAQMLLASEGGSVTAVCRRADRFFRVSWGKTGADRDGSFAVFVNWFEDLGSVAQAERVLAGLALEAQRFAMRGGAA